MFFSFLQLDGFIARNFKNQKSVLGTILDPLADKILISVLTVSLTVVSLLPGMELCCPRIRSPDRPGLTGVKAQPKSLSQPGQSLTRLARPITKVS